VHPHARACTDMYARTRVQVLTMNRLKRGHSYPKRLPYFEDLTFTIPQVNCQ